MNTAPSIQQVSFRSDGIVEITYVEKHEQTESMAIARVLMFHEDEGGRLLEEAQECLVDLLDGMLVKLHTPPVRQR